jgi:hypothetical protein
LTLSVAVASPVPDPGATSAQPVSVRAVHAQFDGAEMENRYCPVGDGTFEGTPDTVKLLQFDATGPGAGDGDAGDG